MSTDYFGIFSFDASRSPRKILILIHTIGIRDERGDFLSEMQYQDDLNAGVSHDLQ